MIHKPGQKGQKNAALRPDDPESLFSGCRGKIPSLKAKNKNPFRGFYFWLYQIPRKPIRSLIKSGARVEMSSNTVSKISRMVKIQVTTLYQPGLA